MNNETFSVLVENKFGVLTRVAGLFSGRGFNIDSLTVSPTQNDNYSRMTIVTHGDAAIMEQIEKQLNKLVEVVKVTRLTQGGFVSRELMLLKVRATDRRSEIIQIAGVFKAQIVDVQLESLTIQATGSTEKLNALVELMRAFGIIELARTGSVALLRSSLTTENLETD
jgi:acetolactate synthase-1/3 small subunit